MKINNNEIFLLYAFIDNNDIIFYVFNINMKNNEKKRFFITQKSLFFQISRDDNIDNIVF